MIYPAKWLFQALHICKLFCVLNVINKDEFSDYQIYLSQNGQFISRKYFHHQYSVYVNLLIYKYILIYNLTPVKNTGVGSHSLFQGILPTQGLYPDLPHCRWILYHLSHQRSPRNTGVGSLFLLQGSSLPRNQTRVFCIAGGFFHQLSYWEDP